MHFIDTLHLLDCILFILGNCCRGMMNYYSIYRIICQSISRRFVFFVDNNFIIYRLKIFIIILIHFIHFGWTSFFPAISSTFFEVILRFCIALIYSPLCPGYNLS